MKNLANHSVKVSSEKEETIAVVC